MAGDRAIVAILLLGSVAFVLTSPLSGAFWWSDAPRHALNGIFLKDVLVALPFSAPRQFAFDWYAQYPALTILFYPPLLYILSAPFFLVFGESHAVAQLVVGLHVVGLAFGLHALARCWLDRWSALAAALILLSLPEVEVWGRQVMQDIPALAYLVWAAFFAVRHARQRDDASLYLMVGFVLASLYMKISVGFLAPVLGVFLLRARGVALLAERRVWIAVAIAVVGVLPLAAMTVMFGQANVQSVAEIADTAASRNTLAGWVWYARQAWDSAGPIPLALAAIGLVSSARRGAPDWQRGERLLLLLWVATGYVMLSFIELKDSRFIVILLPPLAIWCGGGLQTLAEALLPRPAWRAAAVASVGVLLLALTPFDPAPRVDGYREAVRVVARLAAPDSVVLFSGKRDGSFIFNMRTESGRPDLYVVRADKLLLSVSVRRELGVGQTAYSEAEIAELLRNLGVSMVVAQRDFWVDLDQMAKLQRVLDGPDFREVSRIFPISNLPIEDKEIRIYQAVGPVRPRPADLSIDLPIIGRRVEGRTAPR